MKSITSALSAHLDGEVTTLASCWKIERRDGQKFFFTDHDRDIVFEGETYEAESSYDRTAIQSNGDFSVDNLDVHGILDSEKITEEEMRAGLFNRADVYIFIVNWKDPSQGSLKMRRGWFGEFTLLGNGTFQTEIRGLAQALTHNFIEVYTAECRADFCDSRCKLNLADYKHPGTVLTRGDGRQSFVASGLPDPPTAGTSEGAHRYWSFKPTGYPNNVEFEISELRFYDQAGNLITGGSAKDNIPNKKTKPSRLRDGDFKNRWGFAESENELNKEGDEDIAITDVRWWIDFGSAKDISAIEVIITKNVGLAPTAFELQWLDQEPVAGSAWNVAKTCSFVWTAPGQSGLFKLGHPGEGPFSYVDPANGTAMPGPLPGASVYDGGQVEWTTGRNKGRVCEVIGYDETTKTVTLFEGMSYPIEAGDTFTLAQGCDRSLAACKLYNNVINRRAEDYIPGNDEFMKYPDAK